MRTWTIINANQQDWQDYKCDIDTINVALENIINDMSVRTYELRTDTSEDPVISTMLMTRNTANNTIFAVRVYRECNVFDAINYLDRMHEIAANMLESAISDITDNVMKRVRDDAMLD